MKRILLIETSGKTCSVSLAEDERVLVTKQDDQGYSHAAKLAIFIETILQETNLRIQDLTAVAVSSGPGSYTGLRIGSSVAKGICYGAPSLALLAIPTLEIVTHAMLIKYPEYRESLLCPMLDARRMEVYTAIYTWQKDQLKQYMPTQALVIDQHALSDYWQNREVVMFGNGAEKCKEVITHPHARFIDHVHYSSADMATLAFKFYEQKEFQDVAYYEPYYLKDFIAGKPGKNILERLI